MLRRDLPLALALTLPLAATSVAASPAPSEPPAVVPETQPALPHEQPLLRAPAQRLTLDDAVARVRREHPDVDVVGASTRERSSGAVHEVKVLTAKGKVRVIRYDAASGRRLDQ